MIQNRIKETILYPWGDLVELQPSNLKVPYNIEYLKKSILKNGFVMSFYGWEHDGKVMVVDGHSRKDVLLDLIADDIDVPDMLPVTLIDAKDEQEAVRLLVEVFNQKSNPIDQTARDMWFEDNAWDVSEVDWEGVNMVGMVSDEEEIEEKGAVKEKEDKMKITLDYVEDEYHMVKDALAKVSQTPEAAVWKLLEDKRLLEI
jgi:hypothetical protein